MRVTIQCDDLVSVLSRVLDQTRRIGIDVSGISATRGSVSLVLEDAPERLSQTLRGRMTMIEGAISVAMEPCRQ
jgi:hypothetical protein